MSREEGATGPRRYLVEQLNENYGYYLRVGESVAEGRTRFQEIEVVDTPMFGRVLRLDGVFQTSEKDEFFYHENIVHVPAITHAAPRSALVIGGGDGGAVEELLKHGSMERVVLAELDEGVVEAARRYLGEIHHGALDDPRLSVRIMDGKAYVEGTADRYDLVLLDLTDPSGPSQALYTREFYQACRGILNPGGMLALHMESPVSRPRTYNRIMKTLQAVFPTVRPYLVYIPLYGTWWGMATASEGADPTALGEEEVDRRIAERGLSGLQFYNGAMHRAVFALPNFVRDILARPAEPITAASPPLEEEIGLSLGRRLVLEER
jgi:spermidine synthase